MKFEFSEACERIFQILKESLTFSPVLTSPESTKVLVVYCDASRVGLGCVFMQHVNLIDYASRELKVHLNNYRSHNLELTLMVFAVKIWRHYLYGF